MNEVVTKHYGTLLLSQHAAEYSLHSGTLHLTTLIEDYVAILSKPGISIFDRN